MDKDEFWKRMDDRDMELEDRFLDRYIFYGLTNLNTGFDVDSIKYYSEKDFKIILERCEKAGIGIFGIEPWLDGEFYDVITKEELDADADDPVWYNLAFEEFAGRGIELQYSATYHIPGKLLEEFRREYGS